MNKQLLIYSFCIFSSSQGVLFLRCPPFLTHRDRCLCLAHTGVGEGSFHCLIHCGWMPNFLQNSGPLVFPPESAVFSELPPHAPDLTLQS